MNETKHDVERSGETVKNWLKRFLSYLIKQGGTLAKRLGRYGLKMYSDPMKAIQKDGPDKSVLTIKGLTEEEARTFIVESRKNDVLATLKEVDVNGKEPWHGKTIHQQEKLANADIKLAKWKDRAIRFENVPFLNKRFNKKVEHYQGLVEQANMKNKDKRYVFIVNQNHARFVNQVLEKLEQERLNKFHDHNLDDINNDGIVDDRDLTIEKSSLDLTVEDLQGKKEFGNVECRGFQSNVCRQIVPKEDFIKNYQEMYYKSTFGAKVYDEDNMILVYHQKDIHEMNKFLEQEQPAIREYGANGGTTLSHVAGDDSIIRLRFHDEKEMDKFRTEYEGKDYLAIHEKDGITVMTTTSATQEVAANVQAKKQEANEEKDLSLEENSKEFEQQQSSPSLALDEREEYDQPSLENNDIEISNETVDIVDDFEDREV